MRRALLAILICIVVMGLACTKKSAPPSGSGTSGGTGGASSTAVPVPSATPFPGATPRVQGTIPPGIPERLRRPLTREEILQLPPATRDMILRAQGQPLPTPSPTPRASPGPKKKT